MSKKKDKNVITINADAVKRLSDYAENLKEPGDQKQVITAASLKDDICNYSYEITEGVGEGDVHNVKGKGIATDDLIDAMRKLNVHLACVDGVYDDNKIDVADIDRMENHRLTARYVVTGMKIKGSQGMESVILIGSKAMTGTGGRIELQTDPIPTDTLSSYTWYNELEEAAKNLRHEVDLYRRGKCVKQEEQEDPKQLKISDNEEIDLEAARQ